MSHTTFCFHTLLSRSFLTRSASVLAVICSLGAAIPSVQASPDDPGPLFGGPGEGPPYVSRLDARTGWPPMPEKHPHRGGNHDYDAPPSVVYEAPPRRRKKSYTYRKHREYVERPYRKGQESYTGAPYYDADAPTYNDGRPYADNSSKGSGFGRLFPKAHYDSETASYQALKALGRSMVEEIAAEDPAGDSEIPSGYTFLGQFIDHDITLETTTDLGYEIQGDFELKNSRTPDLDLDSVYGGGPRITPHLYQLPYIRVGRIISRRHDPVRHDLFRTKASYHYGPKGGDAVALAGDPRNDENVIVSQLHAAFIAFHNRTADILIEREFGEKRDEYCEGYNDCSTQELAKSLPKKDRKYIFETAKDHTIHYYHRLIAEDFLPRIIGLRHTASLLEKGRDFYFPEGFTANGPRLADLHIPVEFAAAAFRYGHSQVRERYMLREGKSIVLLSNGEDGSPRAFQPVSSRHLVDWRYFFEIDHKPPYGFNYARLIDPELSPGLHQLHFSKVVGLHEVRSLAARNLARGRTMLLPSGQEIARQVLPAMEARGLLGKSNGYGRDHWRAFLLPPDQRTRYFLGEAETPLAYYILQEAQTFGARTYIHAAPAKSYGSRRDRRNYDAHNRPRLYHKTTASHDAKGYGKSDGGHRLGPIGATIVGEVLTGLLEHYRVKTGKGLEYRPAIRGGTSELVLKDGYKTYSKRYLMRNFLIDAGLVVKH